MDRMVVKMVNEAERLMQHIVITGLDHRVPGFHTHCAWLHLIDEDCLKKSEMLFTRFVPRPIFVICISV